MLVETSSKRQYRITILIQNSYDEVLYNREIPPEDHIELISAIKKDLQWQEKPLAKIIKKRPANEN
jgi:hypothetical protein